MKGANIRLRKGFQTADCCFVSESAAKCRLGCTAAGIPAVQEIHTVLQIIYHVVMIVKSFIQSCSLDETPGKIYDDKRIMIGICEYIVRGGKRDGGSV